MYFKLKTNINTIPDYIQVTIPRGVARGVRGSADPSTVTRAPFQLACRIDETTDRSLELLET